MNPTPQNPSIIMAHVESSGTAEIVRVALCSSSEEELKNPPCTELISIAEEAGKLTSIVTVSAPMETVVGKVANEKLVRVPALTVARTGDCISAAAKVYEMSPVLGNLSSSVKVKLVTPPVALEKLPLSDVVEKLPVPSKPLPIVKSDVSKLKLKTSACAGAARQAVRPSKVTIATAVRRRRRAVLVDPGIEKFMAAAL
jgi:hypothetical protein